MTLTLIALLACGETAWDTAPPSPGGYDADTDAPYLGEVEDEAPPSVDLAALGAALDEAIALARDIDGGPVIEAYSALMVQADADCPTWAVSGEIAYWYDSCSSTPGATFDGVGYLYPYDGYRDGGTTWDGEVIYLVGSITGAGGDALVGVGSAGLLEGVSDDGAITTYTVVNSGFAWTGDGAEGTWLADGIDPEMAWSAMSWPELDARLLVIDGAFSVEGGAIEMLVFEQALFINDGVGSTCPEEPSGALSALTSEGVWLDLVFDGADWEDIGLEVEGCDGCGEIWHRGERLGEVCPDFSPLLDWTARPNE